MPKEQELTLKAAAKGFDRTAKDVDKVTEAEAKLKEETKQLVESQKQVAEATLQATEAQEKYTGSLREAGAGLAKIVLSAGGVSFAFRRLGRVLLAGRAIKATVYGITQIILLLKEEIQWRERIVQVMKRQARAQDDLSQKRQGSRAMLAEIAGRRAFGGFESPTVEREVQAKKEAAAAQYTRLSVESLNLAFGTYGDIEGLTRQQLTRAAMLAQFDELHPDDQRSKAAKKRYLERRLKQFSERFETYERTETLAGFGHGRKEFRPAGGTERAQEIWKQLQAGAGAKAELEAEVRKFFGRGKTEEEIAELLKLLQSYRGAPPFQMAPPKRGYEPQAEYDLPYGTGYWGQFKEKLGLWKSKARMPTTEANEIRLFVYNIATAAGRGGPKPPPFKRMEWEYEDYAWGRGRYAWGEPGFMEGSGRGPVTPPTVVNTYNTYNNQNQKHVHRGAGGPQHRITNGVARGRWIEGQF